MSNIIDSIQVSGTVYQIQGSGGGNNVIELTQAQYDALVDKDPTVFYIITDAEAVDLANYYTKSQTSGATQISTALGSKQATLVSGTNIKTINNESILGSGNIDIQGGGGVDVVQTTGTSTTDVMSQDAVTTVINKKLSSVDFAATNWAGTGTTGLRKTVNGSSFTNYAFVASINQKPILSSDYQYVNKFSLVETSAITTSVTSASTDSQVPSAKAVYDQFGGLKLVKLSQAEYDALTTKDSNTLYIING
jgi:hypothetical protein